MTAHNDIDRPLGQQTNPTSLKTRQTGRKRLKVSDAVTAAFGLALLGSASFIALQPSPFLHVTDEAGAETVAATSEPVTEINVGGHLPPAAVPGPKIITVSPTGMSPLSPGATSAGNVIVVRDPSDVRQDSRTAHLPDYTLVEESAIGPLPRRAEDGRRPFDVYARAWSGARGARIALVIGGLSLSQTGTMTAIDRLPPGVTLAFAPNGNSIGRWMQTGRQKGHEILMQLPMEPFDYPGINPGPDTLLVNDEAASNIERLHRVLAKTTNYVGVIGYMGGHFTAEADAMRPVMQELGARGLLYVDDGTSARSTALTLAPQFMTPSATVQTTIDTVTERSEILKKLDELERTARATGSAIGIGSAYDVTVDTVATFIQEAQRRGIEFVPVSALATDPQNR